MEDTNDIATKNFESFPDIAADIINTLLYNGKQVVQEVQLLPAPTESIYQGGHSLRNQLQDLCKYTTVDGQIHTLYMFANQTKKDSKMLLRKAGYTGAAYREQYDKKTPGIFPVIELILYWGNGRWNTASSLRQLFQKKKIPEKAWDYIDNLKLQVFEMRNLPPETRRLFTSDMRIVVDYLAEGNSYRSHQKIIHKEALIKLLRVLSGDNYVDDTAGILADLNMKEEDEISMCELFEQYKRQGIEQGIEAAIIICKEFGASFNETAEKISLRFHLTSEDVQKNMDLYW